MWPFRKKLILEDIETQAGYSLLKALINEGWEVTSQYSDQMFDKGIDFDAYTLQRNSDKIEMEWDNWTEWTLSGPRDVITKIAGCLAPPGPSAR